MKKFLLIIGFISGVVMAQVESVKLNKESFLKPSLTSMNFLISNVDSVKWNTVLLPLGFKTIPTPQKVNALEYKKIAGGITQYIGFDERYWVLTIIYKDESGKNSITGDLKKALKKNKYGPEGQYRITLNAENYIITIESNKEKAINELITFEIERK